jgi:hypothetical protein
MLPRTRDLALAMLQRVLPRLAARRLALPKVAPGRALVRLPLLAGSACFALRFRIRHFPIGHHGLLLVEGSRG